MIQLDRTPGEQSQASLDLANEAAGNTALSVDRSRDLRYIGISNGIQARLDEEDRSRTLRNWILLAILGACVGVLVCLLWAGLIWIGVLR